MTLQAAAEFVEIFEDGAHDRYFQHKSRLEEENMARMAKQFA